MLLVLSHTCMYWLVDTLRLRLLTDHLCITIIIMYVCIYTILWPRSATKYNSLLEKNVSKFYKKGNEKTLAAINNEARSIANKLELDDRI